MDLDEEIEYVLLQKNEVFVYKIPPRPPQGHRAENWKECIWRGKMTVTGKGDKCTIKLLDASSGELFAACPVPENQEQAVERAVDSTRYFVLRISDGQGRYYFIGMGFDSRNDAFDFNCALSDFSRRKEVEREQANAPPLPERPQQDFSLKEGQTIRVELKGRPARKREKDPAAQIEGAQGIAAPAGGLVPPPPPAPGRRQKGTGSSPTKTPGSSKSSNPPSAAASGSAADDAFFTFAAGAADPFAGTPAAPSATAATGPSPAAQAPPAHQGSAGADLLASMDLFDFSDFSSAAPPSTPVDPGLTVAPEFAQRVQSGGGDPGAMAAQAGDVDMDMGTRGNGAKPDHPNFPQET
uniref:NECAP PHear domain-containing protein n=1 Tax=Chromera velia CCMP2878 TaxID=1169474 RepID=A0A0G4HJ31_9ALVE|mmetsp:Transcript_5811/g.11523  ORF Transcript_5811/g.11523 Transcript_5811/m.11523 type:complete len:353 (+) Transcript_5811:259-1317(+)|eukprot:Cvel_7080.t1-p1 / transcript=Cvel_7080.t1 / gene=Cvel_7080 / organism=Chromera_velia_CCMP2878 / gene_product=Uncharacterized protein At1g03900, putative / transcript_product=Uncharacterized protein At1g03900, putative / location=Cvel_scaffold362:30603-31658(-) / protein_length=352 / sequence_SO=supercontig / SO=protein_coding / is_pseudo=false